MPKYLDDFLHKTHPLPENNFFFNWKPVHIIYQSIGNLILIILEIESWVWKSSYLEHFRFLLINYAQLFIEQNSSGQSPIVLKFRENKLDIIQNSAYLILFFHPKA